MTDATPRPIKWKLCGMMFLQYFVQGSYLPIISVYLQDALKFDADAIGIFGSALAVGPLVAPFIVGQLVDRHVSTQSVLAFCHLAGGVLMLALYGQTSFLPVVVLGALYSALYVPTMMLTNSLAFHHLRDSDREFPRIRLWGTIGFVLPAWLIEMYFLQELEGEALNTARGIALVLSGVSGLVMGVYCLFLPPTPPAKSETADLAPGRVIGLLRHRHFLVLVLASFLVAVAHKFFFVWNSPYLKAVLREGGIQSAWEQRISSIGQIFEVVVMAFLGFAVKRLGFKRTMLVGAAAYVLRCLVFAGAISEAAPFPVVMAQVCLGQALHGFCFGCFLATAYMYVDRVAPRDVRGSMQTLYGNVLIGLGMFVGGFVSGRLGALFTTESGVPTVRERLGISAKAGVVSFAETVDGGTREMLRDWAGLWLAGGAIAAVAWIGFALLFPREEVAE